MYPGRGFVLALLIACSLPVWSANEPQPPRLILQITVDQLRGDMLPRYRDRFSAGGFRRLMEQGLWYSNAHYGTSNTFTAAGHAVLVTGADTAQHGMAGNEWFDRASGKPVYCTADPLHPILDDLLSRTGQKPGGGMSPANLTATTFGDELVNASAGRSRVFAVAGKDRSSIIPGGHLGTAYWFSEDTGGFVTSSYYRPRLPEWVTRWNQRAPAQKYRTRPWTLSREAASYRYAASADNRHARAHELVGRQFPHVLDDARGADFYSALRFTPMLDEHTAEFVRELLVQEKLGQETTDYLSVSFSATDYVGHTYGPNSVEYEDNLIRLDATLATVFELVDRQVGAGRTLVVLSADHGVDDIPEERSDHHLDAGRLQGQAAMRDGANAFLKKRLNSGAVMVAEYVPPGIYLDRAAIAAAGLNPETVETALAEYARSLPGVAYALTRTDLIRGAVARTPMMERVQRGFHPERSGDVVVIQDPFWYLDSKADRYAATHGSPYSYDTYVPIIFYGAGIAARTVSRNVEPASIAPTLAALLRIRPPSGAFAPVLSEVLNEH